MAGRMTVEVAHQEIIEQLKRDISSGAIGDADVEALSHYLSALSTPNAYDHFTDRLYPQSCETVRMHLLRAHVAKLGDHVTDLHGHITELNKSNGRMQWAVVALTIATLATAGIQIGFAYRADKRAETESIRLAPPSQTPQTEAPAPTRPPSPSSDRSTKKSP